MQTALDDIKKAHENKKNVAMLVKDRIFQLDQAQHTAQAMQTKIAGYEAQLDKLEPSNATTRKLKAHVKQRESRCMKGLLIDFIECTNPVMNGIVDIAGKQKLFCAIVDTLNDAQELLQLNKEIKGGVVKIYPLETLDQIPVK